MKKYSAQILTILTMILLGAGALLGQGAAP